MIHLPRQVLWQIVTAAESAAPQECCGLLAGRVRANGDALISRVQASPNRSDQPAKRFEIDAQVRFDLMHALDGTDDAILGHYHSHPGRPAQPSQRDLDQAWEPDLIWMIVSLEGGKAIQTTAHVLDAQGRQFREVGIRTTDWEPYPYRDDPAVL